MTLVVARKTVIRDFVPGCSRGDEGVELRPDARLAVERTEGGGAGRPSKHYRAAADAAPLEFPVRSDDLVLTLLGKSLAMLPRERAEAMAEREAHA